jgi:hypothetical protein
MKVPLLLITFKRKNSYPKVGVFPEFVPKVRYYSLSAFGSAAFGSAALSS